MTFSVSNLLGYIGARMLIIDEVHALLASTYRQQRILLNAMRFLANELRIPLVCAGTAEAKTALTTDACRRLMLDRTEGVTVRIVRLL